MRDRILLNTFALTAELEAEMLRQRTQEVFGPLDGRGSTSVEPPFGFDIDGDGYLAPNDDYRRARDAIEAIEEMDWSVRKAARHTGIPRRTLAGIFEGRGCLRRRKVLQQSEAPLPFTSTALCERISFSGDYIGCMGDDSSSDSESSGNSNSSEKNGDATRESLSAQKNVDGEFEAVGRRRQNAKSKNQQHEAEGSKTKAKVEKSSGKEPEGEWTPAPAESESIPSSVSSDGDSSSGDGSGDTNSSDSND